MMDTGERILSEFSDFGVTMAPQVLSPESRLAIETGLPELRHGLTDGSIERNARFVLGVLPQSLRTLYKDPSLVALAKILLGTNNVALYMNRLLMKDSSWDGDVSLHQDASYFSGSQEKLTVFLPLLPTGRKNGGLIFVKGSHRYGCLPRGTVNRHTFAKMDDAEYELEVGDVVLMNHLTWHYSRKSEDIGERPLMQITYQSASDGSYAAKSAGVGEPMLVCGEWQTSYFAPAEGSTTPDA